MNILDKIDGFMNEAKPYRVKFDGGSTGTKKRSGKTIAQQFKQKAKQIMPHQSSLLDLDDTIDSVDEIDDIMFRRGEYIGGMAAVILSIIGK